MDDVARAIAAVRDRIAEAAARAGREAADVSLVAVTKTVDPARIRAAVAAGATDLGENRAQELLRKIDAVPGARWHFVGALQRNKARAVVGRVELIHGVGSLAAAEAVARAASEAGGEQALLLQVNTTGEPTKHGVSPEAAPHAAAEIATLGGIALRGFMTIGPAADLDGARRSFETLRSVRDAAAVDEARELSMGMSDDLEVAIEEGATIVRVGSAIFGSRPVERGRV